MSSSQRRASRRRIFYGWYIVAAGMVSHLWISIAWIYGKQVFFTPIVQTFGWSRAVVSGAFSLERLESSITTPLEGFAVDRFGPRKLILVGGLLAGLGLVSLGFLQDVWMFYASVLVISVGTSASMGVPRTWAIVQWFRRLRGRALGIGGSGAVISGPLLIIVVWLIEAVGWRRAFVVLGIVTWAISIPVALVYRSRPQQYGYLPDGDPPAQATTAAPQRPAGAVAGERVFTVSDALRTPTFWVVTLAFGVLGMGISALGVHQVPYLESIGFTTTQAVSSLGVYTLLSVFGRLGGGWAMDFLDKRLVLAGLLACEALAFLVLANITTYWQVVPFAFLYGTAFGGSIPARGVVISSYFGTRSFGGIQGLSQSAAVLGGTLGPVIMGWDFDVNGSYTRSVYFLMAVAALAVPFSLLARPPRPGAR
ncbi:MAG: MFS transporter [Chloroflexi bacterium]|nr:MFS transporter [Chloroflexota bacterium]